MANKLLPQRKALSKESTKLFPCFWQRRKIVHIRTYAKISIKPKVSNEIGFMLLLLGIIHGTRIIFPDIPVECLGDLGPREEI